jgi:hypothetical protein
MTLLGHRNLLRFMAHTPVVTRWVSQAVSSRNNTLTFTAPSGAIGRGIEQELGLALGEIGHGASGGLEPDRRKPR